MRQGQKLELEYTCNILHKTFSCWVRIDLNSILYNEVTVLPLSDTDTFNAYFCCSYSTYYPSFIHTINQEGNGNPTISC